MKQRTDAVKLKVRCELRTVVCGNTPIESRQIMSYIHYYNYVLYLFVCYNIVTLYIYNSSATLSLSLSPEALCS